VLRHDMPTVPVRLGFPVHNLPGMAAQVIKTLGFFLHLCWQGCSGQDFRKQRLLGTFLECDSKSACVGKERGKGVKLEKGCSRR